jgi:hypothetical protein
MATIVKNQSTQDTKGQQTQDTKGQPIPKDTASTSESAREARGENAPLIPNAPTVKDQQSFPTDRKEVVQEADPREFPKQNTPINAPVNAPISKAAIKGPLAPGKHGVIKSTFRLRPYAKLPGTLYFFCPGCREFHSIHTDKVNQDGVKHILTGTLERPTITPMISRQIEKFNVSKHAHNYDHRCNSFITDGNIRFLENCTHAFAGKVIELPFVD